MVWYMMSECGPCGVESFTGARVAVGGIEREHQGLGEEERRGSIPSLAETDIGIGRDKRRGLLEINRSSDVIDIEMDDL